MFNKNFNALPFNRTADNSEFAFEMNLSLENATIMNAEKGMTVTSDHILEMNTIMTGERSLAFLQEHNHEYNTIMTRDRTMSFIDTLTLEKMFNMARFHVLTLKFTGEFAAGDKIVIDSDRLKFTKNGDNALHEMQGDFIHFYVGENRMAWTDDKANRNVQMRLQYRDRYL